MTSFVPSGRADEHEGSEPLVLEADVEVNAIGPDVDVIAVGERALLPRVVLALPRAYEPRDHARREAGSIVAEQRRERAAEVAGRQAAQIQRRKELRNRLRLAKVRGQDLARELLPLAVDDVLVVDARRTHFEHARAHRHRARLRAAVANDERVPRRVSHAAVSLDVRLDLRFQRLFQHPLRSFTRQAIQRGHLASALVLVPLLDYLQHRRAFPALPGAVAGGCFHLERYAASSAHDAPQLLVISPGRIGADRSG